MVASPSWGDMRLRPSSTIRLLRPALIRCWSGVYAPGSLYAPQTDFLAGLEEHALPAGDARVGGFAHGGAGTAGELWRRDLSGLAHPTARVSRVNNTCATILIQKQLPGGRFSKCLSFWSLRKNWLLPKIQVTDVQMCFRFLVLKKNWVRF